MGYALVLRRECSYGGVRIGVELHLDQVAVDPDCRSLGVGACLMNQVMDQCGPDGGVVTAWACQERVFSQWGFYEVDPAGCEHEEPWPTAVFMRSELQADSDVDDQ